MADRTEQARVQFDSIAENPENLNRVLEALFDGVYFVDQHRCIQEWNAGAEVLTGYNREEVRHRSCADNVLVHVDECGTELCRNGCPLQKTLLDGEMRQAKVFLRHRQGYRVPVAIRTVAVRDSHSNIIGAIETFREIGDAEQWKARIGELERAAYLDPLTGIPNRRFLEAQLERLLRDFAATGRNFAVVLLDLDGFKRVNDTYGHDVGDRVVCNVARTLTHTLRGQDILGRWGGDEFVMLLVAANRQQCASLAERARVLIAQTATSSGTDYLCLTASIGIAFSLEGDTPESILKRADEQLYRAKHCGRNCCSAE